MRNSCIVGMPHTPEPTCSHLPAAAPGLLRRLAAGFYDLIMLTAICMVVTLLVVICTRAGDLRAFYDNHAGAKLIYQAGLLAVGFAFFGGFWAHGGQTIGMRTWKLRVVCMNGGPLGWRRALIRYLSMLIPWLLLLLGSELLFNSGRQPQAVIYRISAACVLVLAGLVFIWPAFDPEKLAWHDRLSSTRLLLLRPPLKHGKQ
jgi:uncharacterized RDD family membrane protein YckC